MKVKAIFGALTTALVAAPSALAVGSAQSVYGGTEGVSQAQVQAANQAATVSSSGSLPFTGLDLMLLVGGGVLLLLTGIALYLVSRPRTTV
ncbi:MAG TPA: hypothetical protein VIJ84_08185 [Gaiellaceae bacterium]